MITRTAIIVIVITSSERTPFEGVAFNFFSSVAFLLHAVCVYLGERCNFFLLCVPHTSLDSLTPSSSQASSSIQPAKPLPCSMLTAVSAAFVHFWNSDWREIAFHALSVFGDTCLLLSPFKGLRQRRDGTFLPLLLFRDGGCCDAILSAVSAGWNDAAGKQLLPNFRSNSVAIVAVPAGSR